jgi:simple sugar transport system ATP-binding protein
VTLRARRDDTAMPILRVAGIRKTYGAVEALKGIDLEIHAGEIVAMCGDNGAGKSTFVKIASGALSPTAGAIEFEGQSVSFASPLEALRSGIATIYQDLALAARLSVWQNIFIGAELMRPVSPWFHLLNKRRMRAEALRYFSRLKVDISDPNRRVELLSGGQRQAVAIARALHWEARLVIMDEPTAALGVAESRRVLDLIRQLREGGGAVLLVSHNMADVVEVATRAIVLKGGRKIFDDSIGRMSADDLGNIVMTGHVPESNPRA